MSSAGVLWVSHGAKSTSLDSQWGVPTYPEVKYLPHCLRDVTRSLKNQTSSLLQDTTLFILGGNQSIFTSNTARSGLFKLHLISGVGFCGKFSSRLANLDLRDKRFDVCLASIDPDRDALWFHTSQGPGVLQEVFTPLRGDQGAYLSRLMTDMHLT